MSNNISCLTEEHIAFEDMADFIFNEDVSLEIAAKFNKHMMECSKCYQMYDALYTLHESMDEYLNAETDGEKLRTRIFEVLWSVRKSEPVEKLVAECGRFRHWISLEVNSAKRLVQMDASDFAHPKLVTVMKSSTGDDSEKITQSVIRSSLSDENNNRVSIGLDGTLSLYFSLSEHPVGQRVILLPDDPEAVPQIAALDGYDSSISFVRFEGICPGQYTIAVEQ